MAGLFKIRRRRTGWIGAFAALSGVLAWQAAAQSPPVTPDDFVASAGGSHQYEMMAARLALVESRDAAVRAFAQQMLRDHEAADAALREASTRSGLKPPPTSVGGDQTMLLAALQGLRGSEFNRAYAHQQVLAHRYALTAEGGYARNGSDPNLRAVARADLPMIEGHLQKAEALDTSTMN